MTPRYILVTGAGSGIGRAITQALIADGQVVAATGRREALLHELIPPDAASGCIAHACDMADPAAVEALFALLAKRWPRLDAVVHCAGVYGPIGLFHETDPQEWLGAITNNLFGFYLVARAAVPQLQHGHLPRILAVAGGGAFTPLPRCSAYGSAKAGIVRLVETAAGELAPLGIAALALAPGFVATDIHRETIKAGPEKAGRDYYEFTLSRLKEGSVPMSLVVDCARFLLGDAAHALSGRTISASFDPWAEPEFLDSLPLLEGSELYRGERVNLRHLPPGDPLREALTSAQSRTYVARRQAAATAGAAKHPEGEDGMEKAAEAPGRRPGRAHG
ncbi:SDR family NAD(P)-dependent oxidoreductase [Marinibaculum pumilum]|uniref:SDR family NAD(P)-dependent oxidoreductase n=1 Tax=Marinibaculum pumilum TaxID=1766165 RepID=A0ABV7KYQ7_9PROT